MRGTLSLALALAFAAPALAQAPSPDAHPPTVPDGHPPPSPDAHTPATSDAHPAPGADARPAPRPASPAQARKAELENLLGALKSAPTEEAAGALETRIRQIWLGSGSPAATLLMNRGMRDLQNEAGEDAVADFDAVLALEPELAVAYERRAVARFQSGDYVGAVADIQQSLQREPRNFAALQSLSRIAEARGDLRGALLAWRKALEVDPKTPNGDKRLRDLTRKVDGQAT